MRHWLELASVLAQYLHGGGVGAQAGKKRMAVPLGEPWLATDKFSQVLNDNRCY